MTARPRLIRWRCRRCPAAGYAYSLAEVRAHVDGHPAPGSTTHTRLSLMGTGR